MENLDERIGAVIDVDGVRYLLVGLDRDDVLLRPATGDGQPIRMRRDYVAEAMVQVLSRAARAPGRRGSR